MNGCAGLATIAKGCGGQQCHISTKSSTRNQRRDLAEIPGRMLSNAEILEAGRRANSAGFLRQGELH
jgi:hypothetical protein